MIENKIIKTNLGDIEVIFKSDLRVKRYKIKINQKGEVFVVYKKSFFKNIQKGFLISFVKLNAKWIFENKKKVLRKKDNYDSKINVFFTRKEFLENKEKLRILAKERIEYFNNFYKFEFNKIFIKNQKTRWGSCSSKKNLNFNISILKLPKNLQDLIFVHELCHLKEMNHSGKFWDLVEMQITDYRVLNKELKKYSVNNVD